MRGIGRLEVILGLAAMVLLATPAIKPILSAAQAPATFMAGADIEDISPTAAMITPHHFYLGGFGLSNGVVGAGGNGFQTPVVNPRFAQGVMHMCGVTPCGPTNMLGRPTVRVVVISTVDSDNVRRNLAFADLDNQGTFPAYKLNSTNAATRPYGFDFVRSKIALDLAGDANGGLNFAGMTISSDHSHGGQDMTGVWGFVPDEYLKLVYDAEVKAFETAYHNLQPATISEGAVTTPHCVSSGPQPNPPNILNNQFDCSATPNDIMDDELRVMQAYAVSDGHKIFTLANFAAHATVMGSGNRLVSPDWPSVAAEYLQKDTHSDVGIVIVSDVGRSQPNRTDCTTAELATSKAGLGPYDTDNSIILQSDGTTPDPTTEPSETCKLSKYSKSFESWADQAIASETPLTAGQIDSRELFVYDCPITNGAIYALNDAGDAVGAPIARQNIAPYQLPGCLGTWVGVHRIGDLVITTNPGEAYPNIRQQFMDAVPGGRRYWTTGLSNDQLGYLIAPFPEGYPQAIQASAGGNDNILFNASETIGDRVICTQVKGAIQMGIVTNPPAKCAVYTTGDTPYIGGVDTGPAPNNPPPSAFTAPAATVPEVPLTGALVLAGIGALITVRRWQRASS